MTDVPDAGRNKKRAAGGTHASSHDGYATVSPGDHGTRRETALGPAGYGGGCRVTMYRGIMLAQACNVSATPVMERYGVAPAGALPVFIDSAPVVGANYYEVTAYNSEGESLPSNRVCFARQAVVTSAPRNLGIEP